MRDCGRHACRRRCCDGDCPPCAEVPITVLGFYIQFFIYGGLLTLHNFRFVAGGYDVRTTNVRPHVIGMSLLSLYVMIV